MFLVCGEALYDLFLTEEASLTDLTFEARAGGSPFNVAIGIARQGGRAALLTGISSDLLGNRLVAKLNAEQVDTGYLVRSDRRSTLSIVDLTKQGQPDYAFYGLGSADCSLTSQDVPTLGSGVTSLHVGSYSIVVEPVASTFAELIEANKERFVSLDPNVRPTVEPDMSVWRAAIDRLLPNVDLVKVSGEDLGLLYPSIGFEDVAFDWLRRGPSMVTITDGAERVSCYRNSGCISTLPPTVEVVDTVGAGDGFQAALLAPFSNERDPRTALVAMSDDALARILAHAAKVAAVTCSRRGADIPCIDPN